MKAVVWQGKEDVRVDEVPDPALREATDAIVRVTSTAICGSDLHLYAKLGAVMREGDVLGHEAMGIVEEVGSDVNHIRPGDRVVVPFNISCGSCFFCERELYSQCETTRDTGTLPRLASLLRRGKGASLFGYTHLYGAVPGGQAEYLRVPEAHFGPIPVPQGPPDTRYLFLSDVLPTAWQAVVYADVPAGGTVAVFGLGPIGQMCARIALLRGAGQVFGIDRIPARLAMAARHGVETIDEEAVDEDDVVLDLTGGRGADSVIDAVGMEAHGSDAGRRPADNEDPARPHARALAVHALDPPRRHAVALGRLLGAGAPLPARRSLRHGRNAPDGASERAPLGARAPASPRRRHRSTRDRRLHDARATARRSASGIRDVPAQGGRIDQGRPPPGAGGGAAHA